MADTADVEMIGNKQVHMAEEVEHAIKVLGRRLRDTAPEPGERCVC
jgi:hypothetical protein